MNLKENTQDMEQLQLDELAQKFQAEITPIAYWLVTKASTVENMANQIEQKFVELGLKVEDQIKLFEAVCNAIVQELANRQQEDSKIIPLYPDIEVDYEEVTGENEQDRTILPNEGNIE